MKNILTRVFAISGALFFALFLTACGGRKKEKETDEMARMEQSDTKAEVGVMVLREVPFHRQIATNGRLRALNKSTLSFKSSGVIERVLVENGQSVAAGTPLAELEKTDAENTLTSAKLNFEKAKIDLNDAIIGFGYSGVDAPEIPERTMELARIRSGYNSSELNLKNAEKTLSDCTLRAPFAGKIADIKGHAHERGGGDFCTLVDDSRLLVEFSVLETELDFVRKGNVVNVASFFDPDNRVEGRITAVNPVVNDKGQVLVEAEIANNGTFIDGMNVKLIAERELPGQLVVPKSAVVIRDNLEVLFRYRNGRAQWTYVHTVMENSSEYVVRANTEREADLSVGDTIIVTGNMNLAHDTEVSLSEELGVRN